MNYELPIDINTIYELMPHRYPFLLIDKIIDFKSNKSIVAIKNVTINEPFFQGHFPIYPVMPGVLIIESLAQAAGMLAILSLGERKNNDIYFFVGIDDARFKKQVIPGDKLHLEVEVLQVKKDIGKFKAIAKVDDQVVAYATLLCAKRTV